jgi:hypothetical protein
MVERGERPEDLVVNLGMKSGSPLERSTGNRVFSRGAIHSFT